MSHHSADDDGVGERWTTLSWWKTDVLSASSGAHSTAIAAFTIDGPPASTDKGRAAAPSLSPAAASPRPPHVTGAVDLASSFELPSPSGDSPPAQDPASRKQTKTSKRKPGKPKARWSRGGGGSTDDTGADFKASPSQSSSSNSLPTGQSPPPLRAPGRPHFQPTIAPENASPHRGRFMAANLGGSSGDSRRGVASPRPKGREAKNTFCRNVTIYGHCRYENTCPYIHDQSQLNKYANAKKTFNVDSPSFTPLQASTNGSLTPSARSAAISPKAANAAVFTPKSQRSAVSTPSLHTKEPALEWHPQEFQEFVPQGYDGQMVDPTAQASALAYDPFSSASAVPAIGGSGHQASSINPYAQDPSGLTGASYYQPTNTFQTTPSYHLYWPIGPQPTNLLPYQRTAHDFFIPDALREELQRKAEVARSIFPNSALPHVEHFHTLYCLDTAQQKNQTLFGYQTLIYKAVSSKDGLTYALRRLENYRLTNENAIRSIQPWKRVFNANVVTIHDAFTTRAFGDSSLILVTDYHSCSKTLAEEHYKSTAMPRFHGRQAASTHVPEQVLWSYLVQIGSALKAIHGVGLAARLIAPSKIILTSKNRIRLNACGILDVVNFDNMRPLGELQADDLLQLGRLILGLANNNPNAHLALQKSMDFVTRSYTGRLKECIQWLLNPQPTPTTPTSPTGGPTVAKDIDNFLSGIADQFAVVFDSELHAGDVLTSVVSRELEASRLVRLLVKLNMINERPELDASIPIPAANASSTSTSWAETGERYYLKLFRDYVFHTVDANGHPKIDLAHVIDNLNKLDAGSDDRVALVSRDEQNVLVVTYRELKKGLESSFQDLVSKASRAGR